MSAPCCTGDRGRSSVAALQEEATNHRQVRQLRAVRAERCGEAAPLSASGREGLQGCKLPVWAAPEVHPHRFCPSSSLAIRARGVRRCLVRHRPCLSACAGAASAPFEVSAPRAGVRGPGSHRRPRHPPLKCVPVRRAPWARISSPCSRRVPACAFRVRRASHATLTCCERSALHIAAARRRRASVSHRMRTRAAPGAGSRAELRRQAALSAARPARPSTSFTPSSVPGPPSVAVLWTLSDCAYPLAGVRLHGGPRPRSLCVGEGACGACRLVYRTHKGVVDS